MTTALTLTYILLFSIGCVGTVCLAFIYRASQKRLTRLLFLLICVLLFSCGRVLVQHYLAIMEVPSSIPGFLQAAIGIGIVLAVYAILYAIARELLPKWRRAHIIAHAAVFSLQVIRTIIFFTDPVLFTRTYPFFIFLISAYLFYIGFVFYHGSGSVDERPVQRFLRGTGLLTLFFGPLSFLLYLARYLLSAFTYTISLDFLFLAALSIVSIAVVLQYIARIGTVPPQTSTDDTVISRYNLTNREREVLNYVIQGYSNKEIADALYISMTTARTHVSHILEKTGSRNRVQLVHTVLSNPGGTRPDT